MQLSLYDEWVPWYRLVDPPADHLEEALAFRAAFEGAITPQPQTLLELGSGAGHNAVHLKDRFCCTLVDLSPRMAALSRELNPECEHLIADMRTLRLARSFDAVLVHDAIMYMTTEDDLRAAVQTAFEHTRRGGAAIIAPDILRDVFQETARHEQAAEGARALQSLMWDWDPDASDDSFVTEFTLLLRDGQHVEAVHERHVQGLFWRATWLRILEQVGFTVETLARPIGDGTSDEIFLCRK